MKKYIYTKLSLALSALLFLSISNLKLYKSWMRRGIFSFGRLILGVIWFIWSVTVDSIEINKNKAWMQKIKDEEFEKYKSYYERSKKKKKKKTKKY